MKLISSEPRRSYSSSYVSQLESGRLDVALTDLVALSAALDKPVRYFLPVYEVREGQLTPEEESLVQQFRQIKSPSLREAASAHIAQLAKAEQGTNRKK